MEDRKITHLVFTGINMPKDVYNVNEPVCTACST